MKTIKIKTFKTLFLLATLALTSFQVFAKDQDDGRDDRGNNQNDYAYYIMSPKNWHQNNDNDDDNWLRIFSKAGETKSVSFKGKIQIPESLRANTALLREGNSQALLILDGRVQCTYQAHFTKKYYNAIYGFVSCSDGTRVKEEVRVDSSVGIYLKEAKGTPATLYASIKITEKFSKGIKLPQLDASKGQILRFDGDLWVPSNYIPDGQAAGDVLLWDGTSWMASKLGTGSQGPQGPAGIQGPQGEQGLQGPQGAQGPQGPQGLIGPAGANGSTGAIGPQGPQGLVGATGATGAQGPQGIQGLKGDKGDVGDPGLVSLTAGNGILGGTISGNGGTIAVNTGTAAGQIPVIDSTGKLPAAILPDVPQKIAFIKDIKPNGVNGGTCDSTKNWEQIRDLNSVSGDSSFITLANNQFTLPAGTYIVEANAPAYLDGFHKAALVNVATSEFVLLGSNARSHNVAGGMEPSIIMGQITLTAPTSFVIKHKCLTTLATMGFGVAINFGVEEVYTQMKITKLK